MGDVAAEPDRFAKLFDKPSVDEMYALSAREFEHFVAYVLRRAGYEVKEVGPHWLRGVDLEMRLAGKSRIVGGVECKRFREDQLVTSSVVKGVKGAPAVGRPGAKPFVFTTSDFNDPAHQMALATGKRVHLLNGSQIVRYIAYIQRSRYNDDDVITSLSPEFFAGRDSIRPRKTGSTNILAIANNKGGVGKTTTAYYLGMELASKGNRVLMIDLDGQGNLTERCIPEYVNAHKNDSDQFHSIAHYFAGDRPLQALIVPSETASGLSLIPSDPFLTLRDLGGNGRPEVELRFVEDVQKLCMQPIASLGGRADWIILDTPPALSVFTRAGLAVAQYVLAPIRPRQASLAGTQHMLRTLQTMNALMGTQAAFLGVAITHWDELKLSRGFEETDLPQLLRGTGGRTFTSKIPIDNQLEFVEPGAKTRGAKAYGALVDELLDDVEQRSKASAMATIGGINA